MKSYILGPLEVLVDDQPVALGGLKQRALLAMLVVRMNNVLSVEALVDVLWPTDPPRTAVRQVQDLVSQLRRAIGSNDTGRTRGDHVIETRPGGYVLGGDPDDVDAHRFTALLTAGRDAMGQGRHRIAADRFRTALDLWRGESLLDIGLPAVRREAKRLDEQRLTAYEAWIDAEIALGTASHVIGQLDALVDEYPLREVFRRQLMIALHQAERRADALQVYRAGRELLVSELGIEPGTALQDVHRMVLGEDGTNLVQPPPRATRSRAPRQLPPDLLDFVGRGDEVRSLSRWVTPPREDTARRAGRVMAAVITGGGGAGKSSLALRVAHRTGASFPDGHLFVDLRGDAAIPADLVDVLGGLLRDLGVPSTELPDGLTARTTLLRTLLDDRRVLIVLDDARDERQVLPLLPASPGSAVLITTRRRLDLGGYAMGIDLGPFTCAEALVLLSGIIGSERVENERSAAVDLVRACDHLPLAVRIAAGRLASRPSWRITDLATRIGSAHGLDELSIGNTSVRHSLGRSYRALNTAQRRAFRLLGLMETRHFDVPAAQTLLGMSSQTTEHLLESLVDNYLLVSVKQRSYRMPALLRRYAQKRLDLEYLRASRSSDSEWCSEETRMRSARREP